MAHVTSCGLPPSRPLSILLAPFLVCLLLRLHPELQLPLYYAEQVFSSHKPLHLNSILLGASVRHSARGKGHEEGGLTYAKAGSSLRSPPGNPRASTPITRACLLYYFVLSPTPLTLRGDVPPPTSFGEGVNLELQLIIIPGRDRSVSTYKLLWRFSSLPDRLVRPHVDCSQPPNRERHEML